MSKDIKTVQERILKAKQENAFLQGESNFLESISAELQGTKDQSEAKHILKHL